MQMKLWLWIETKKCSRDLHFSFCEQLWTRDPSVPLSQGTKQGVRSMGTGSILPYSPLQMFSEGFNSLLQGSVEVFKFSCNPDKSHTWQRQTVVARRWKTQDQHQIQHRWSPSSSLGFVCTAGQLDRRSELFAGQPLPPVLAEWNS